MSEPKATNSSEDTPSPSSLELLSRRCTAANLPLTHVPVDPENDEEEYWTIEFPCGQGKRKTFIRTQRRVDELLAIDFERFSFLTDYEALVIKDEKLIEAPIRLLQFFTSTLVSRLTGSAVDEVPAAGRVFAIANKVVGGANVEVSLQVISPACAQMLFPFRRSGLPSLQIKGIDVSTHDTATEQLKQISTALFLQIDLTHGIPLSLMARRTSAIRRRRPSPSSQDKIVFPTYEYEEAPSSLYFYGRGARGMPLLQFLAFYQTIEFYFPAYSQASARRRIRLILKDPRFRADRDTDLAKILTTIVPGSRYGFGDERSQLKATIHECVNPNELRDFIEGAEEFKEFLKSKHKGLTEVKLPIDNKDADLRDATAERIYDIRCRIVHTKGNTPEVDMILPSSKEASMLHFDVELVQFVAAKTLLAAGAPLTPKT